MTEEIKEISKVDKQLLDKIEHILGSELSNEEYDKFYNYFNEIRKPNILIDIKDVENIKDYITNLQKENTDLKELCDKYEEEHSKAFKLWTMKMEEMPDYEERMNYKSRNEKAVEYIKNTTLYGFRSGKTLLSNYLDDLLNILEGGDE